MASIKERIDSQISRGLIAKAKVSIKELLLQEDKDKFYADMRGVYSELYPQYRPFKDEDEQQEYWKAYRDSEDALADKDGIAKEQVGIQEFDKWVKLAPQVVVIDYSEDENYLSFEDFKNETKVITEAVYYSYEEYVDKAEELNVVVVDEEEYSEVRQVKDEEVTEPIRGYVAVDVTDRVNEYGPLKVKAAEIVEKKYQSQADALVAGYSKFEIESFGIQEAEANAYILDNDAPTPMLDALVAARELDKGVLISKVIEKAGLFKIAIGTLLGAKQKELG